MSKSNRVAEAADENDAIAARILAEAEKVLGITGPKYAITVDGRPYRLMQSPEDDLAKATAMWSEMLYLVRWWLGRHPEVAEAIDKYGMPMDDEVKELPTSIQACIFLGLGLEIYARKNGGAELLDNKD